MNQNYFLKRILVLIAIALAITTILIASIYAIVAPQKVADANAQQLLPRAQAAAELLGNGWYGDSEFNINELKSLLGSEQSILNSYIYALFTDGTIIYTQENNQSVAPSDVTLNLLRAYSDSISPKDGFTTTADIQDGRGNCLLAGASILSPAIEGSEPKVIGTIFLTQTLEETNDAFRSLTITLIITLCCVFTVMMIISFFVARALTRPIVQMQEVALDIAGGDFTSRVDEESVKGEIHELAHTINYLATRVDENLSSVIQERNRLLQFFDGLNEGIMALDTQGHITHANPALYHLMECDESTPYAELEQTEFLASALGDVDMLIRTRSSAIKQLILNDKLIRIILTPLLNAQDECEGVVVLFSDISESERLEQTRREYVANVSHELRTPVSSLIGLAETLNDDMITGESDKKRYYSLILKESHRLSRLINDLLELSRLQEGRARAEIVRTDLYDVVRDSIEVFQSSAEEKGVTLVVDPDFAQCPRAMTDPDRIDQVLVILTDNALRYTPAGGTIRYSAQWDDETIEVTVEDSGSGISAKDLPHVFDRFYKADTSYASTSTGLGLSIAQKALGLIGQEIWVKSEPGHGAAFTFTVRRA